VYSYMTHLFLFKFQHIPLISERVFFSFPVLQEEHGCKNVTSALKYKTDIFTFGKSKENCSHHVTHTHIFAII